MYTPAASVGPLALKVARHRMTDKGRSHGPRMHKFAAEYELVPPVVREKLTAMGGL